MILAEQKRSGFRQKEKKAAFIGKYACARPGRRLREKQNKNVGFALGVHFNS